MNKLVLLSVLLVFCATLFADAQGDSLANYSAALQASVNVQNVTLSSSPQAVPVDVTIYNPTDDPLLVYLLASNGNSWSVIGVIGAVPPSSQLSKELEVQVQYGQSAEKTDRFLIAGTGDDGITYGTSFDLREDWSGYENSLQQSISGP